MALVLRHHQLDATIVTIVVTVALGLPVTWLTWATYREARKPASPQTMAQVADQLALAVDNQWKSEATLRRLNEPYPLPVSWIPANSSLTDAWESLVRLASSGMGWPVPSSTDIWAAGPDGLTGADGDLVNTLARVPTGRLAVLGEPGSGKTILMVRLVLDLLGRRTDGAPVPILASVASWNPADQDLRGWLGAQLALNYPFLAAAPPISTEEDTQASALVAAGLILPVLDGLDEIPERVRGSAISKINDALRPGEQLVVTCRSQDYRDAARPEDGVEVTLRGAAAVQLRSLEAGTIRDYLREDAAGPVAKARWEPVFAVLGTEAPIGQALTTPLMAGLARAIYNPRPDEQVGALRDPAELCNPALANKTAVEQFLFDAFIPAVYRRDPGRWKMQNVQRWLMFLARYLERGIVSPDLAWWQLPLVVPSVMKMYFVLHAPGEGAALSFQEERTPSNIESAASPTMLLKKERLYAIVWGVVAGIVTGVAAGILRVVLSTGTDVSAVVIGVGVGVVLGIGACSQTAWPWYVAARVWLALHHRLPWRLMAFLADAHRRGVLRQAGAVYQFRHIELQHRLATQARPSNP